MQEVGNLKSETTIFLPSNYMHFGYINEIIDHCIDIFSKYGQFQMQHSAKPKSPPGSGKNYEKILSSISDLETRELMP